MITIEQVKQLIKTNFPEWLDEAITLVKNQGHDNTTFHLGKDKLIRMPNSKEYEAQIQKESKWLPIISQYVSVSVPRQVGLGYPSDNYPFHFSINQYIPGCDLNETKVSQEQLAKELANFLTELQQIPVEDDILAGEHNFFRGGDLIYFKCGCSHS